MNEAYIVAYSRSAFAKAKKGGFRSLRSDDMAIQVIQNLMRQVPQLNANQIDDPLSLQPGQILAIPTLS